MSNPLAPGADVNPIKSDPDLQALLKRLDNVKKYKTFQRWKHKFLDRLEQFLYEKGMKPADKACTDFSNILKQFAKKAGKVQDHIESGDLGDNKKTVKAALALNEMCSSLTKVVYDIEHLIPHKKEDEKKRGFSKFHLGACLIRQGFHQYVTMKAIEDVLLDIASKLQNVADRQQLDLMVEFKKMVQRFCDVMADLNLYEVMLKCLEFLEAPGEEESSDEEPVMIKITIDTHDGKVLTLVLDETDNIGNVKAAIVESSGIPFDKQVMKFKGKELTNKDATLKSLGIGDGAKLTVEPFRVPVTVNSYDGKKIKLMVDPNDYITDLKVQLEAESGIPAKNQALFMKGAELNDLSKTAGDYGIKAGTVLDLEPKVMNVNVKMPDGKSISVQVKANDTAEEIKQKIADETGLKVPQQVIKFKGKEMKDGQKAKDVGITDGSELDVELFKVPVTVNTMDGKQIKLMVDPTDYISDLKNQLEGESGIDAKNQALFMNGDELSDANKTAGDYGIKAGSVLDLEPKVMNVTVKTPDGKSITVQVKANDTAEAIKEKISKETGLKVPQQVIKHKGKEMKDGQTAKDVGITDGSVLDVDIFKVPVTVNTMDGKSIKVMVDPTDYISDLKKQLEGQSGVDAKNQKLSMDGKELEDPKTAGECGIKPGSVIDLDPKVINVTVKTPDGRSTTVEVKSDDTADAVKQKISKATGLKVPQQIIKFKGKEMKDKETVKTMGIQDGSVLDVDIFKVPVTVNTMDGKSIKVMVDPTDYISDLKKQLEGESGVAANNQKLSMGGKVFEDSKTAGDYGVKPGSVIDLEPKVITINVKTPSGKTISVQVNATDKGEAVKAKIAKEVGMKVAQQVLKYNGKEVPDNKTIKDMGIKDGSDLTVEIFKVPVTVSTIDGKKIKVMVDPTAPISDIKRQLEKETGVPANNQRLFMAGDELEDSNKSAKDYDIKAGTVLEMEPKVMKVTVETPDGKKHTIDVKPSDTDEDIKATIAKASGMEAPRQVLKLNGKDLPHGKTAKQMGIREGSDIKVDIFTIPVTVKKPDGKIISIKVEPTHSIEQVKKVIEKETGMLVKKQILRLGEEELKNDSAKAKDCGIKAGSELLLEELEDSIVFVDIKCGTLFAMDRELVIKQQVLTPYQNNKLEFNEAAKDSAARDKILEALKGSPTLGFAPQVVVTGLDVEEYELEEKEKVSAVWGVSLKKQKRNKKGEEFIFIDCKTGAAGELSRQKYLDSKFITIESTPKGDTLVQREKDTLKYDKHILKIRAAFGLKEFK